MTKLTCSLSDLYHAYVALITRRRKPRTSDTATAARRRSILVSGKSRMIFGAYPYVADTIESNTKWGTRRSFGIKR